MSLTISHAFGRTDPPVRDITVGDLLKEAADSVPGRVGLIEGIVDVDARRQWTYREFYDDALRVARALSLRFEKGERVAVWAHNIPEWVLLEFGCALAGVVLVTVNPAYRSHEVEYVLKQSRAAGLFVVPDFRGNPMLAVAEQVQPECPDLREIISFDDWASFLDSGESFEGDLPVVEPTDSMMI